MHILTAIQSLFLLAMPLASSNDVEIEPVNFRIQVYPYGGYYSYPPYCPPGYTYGPGFGYRRRGFSFYFGPGYGYPGCYYYGGRYYYGRRYWGPRYYYYGRSGRHRRKK